MSVFSRRSSGYKAGVTLLFFSTFAFLVGFATPYWYYYAASSDDSVNQGLWISCKGDNCAGSYHILRTVMALCLIGLTTACLYAIITNCCRCSAPVPVTRILEALSAVSGVLGFIGCLVHIGVPAGNIRWSCYLSAIGSAFCVVAAIIIGVWNKPLGRPNGFQVITLATISQDQGYKTPGGQAQAQPYGNAQSHGGHQSYGNDQPYRNPQADGNDQPYRNPQADGNDQPYRNPQTDGNDQPYGNPQAYGNAQPYGNPQGYGNAQPYGNPQPYEIPPTYSSLQLNNQADQTGQGYIGLQTVKAGYPGEAP